MPISDGNLRSLDLNLGNTEAKRFPGLEAFPLPELLLRKKKAATNSSTLVG